MGQRSIRFSDELEARVEAVARRDDRSFSYVVIKATERALESALNDRETEAAPGGIPAPSASSERTSVPSRAPDEPVATVLGAEVFKGASVPAFKCPIARCEFTAKSPAAKCGAHGRTVVPV